jgi:hypothetical protein
MAVYSVYAEINGSPLYAEWETDSETEHEVWEEIVSEFESTLQFDKED